MASACQETILGRFIDIAHLLRLNLEELSRKMKFVKFTHFVRLPDYSDLLFVWANARLARNNYSIVPQESDLKPISKLDSDVTRC